MTSRNKREGFYAGRVKIYLLMANLSLKLLKVDHSRTFNPALSLRYQNNAKD